MSWPRTASASAATSSRRGATTSTTGLSTGSFGTTSSATTSSGSSPNAEVHMVVSRGVWQLAAGLLIASVGGTAWAKAPVASYSDAELRAVESADEAKIRSLRHEEINQLRITLGRHGPA